MFDGLFWLLAMGAMMAVSSFLAGSLPLSLSLSQRQLRFISALGTGVLVGTALIVIIPEGVDTLYASAAASSAHMLRRRADDDGDTDDDLDDGWEEVKPHHRDPHAWIGLSLIFGFILMYLIDTVPHARRSRHQQSSQPLHISLNDLSLGPHRADQSPRLSAADAPHHISPPPTPASAASSSPSFRNARSTTIGLVIHSLADGIALGASSAASSTTPPNSSPSPSSPAEPHRDLSLIVFLALMLHKAPAAFGLTSVLLRSGGLSKRAARAHLAVFALAAPAGALATWLLIGLVGQGWLGGQSDSAFGTGVLLLFSGGTFLYVATHSLRPVAASSHSSSSSHGRRSDGYASLEDGVFADDGYGAGVRGRMVNGGAGHGRQASDGRLAREAGGAGLEGEGDKEDKTLGEIGACVLGMLLPLVAQAGHAH